MNPQQPPIPFAIDPADSEDASPAPSPEDQALLDRVQARVMKEIAAESLPHHVFVQAEEGTWEPFLPGIERKTVHATAEGASYLLRLAPGAVLRAHRHPQEEETVVLQGALQIGAVVLGPGGYHRVAAGGLDPDATAVDATLLFVRGAAPRVRQLL